MFRTVPLSVIKNFSLTTQQWYKLYRFVVWHIPLLCVQWKTLEDGQRNCPKHAEFYSFYKIHLINIDQTAPFLSRTNTMEVSPPWEAKSSSASPEIQWISTRTPFNVIGISEQAVHCIFRTKCLLLWMVQVVPKRPPSILKDVIHIVLSKQQIPFRKSSNFLQIRKSVLHVS